MIPLKLLRAEAKRVFGPRGQVVTNYKFPSDACAYVLPSAGIKFRELYANTANQVDSRALLYAALRGLPSCE